jgi:hypothetical protein
MSEKKQNKTNIFKIMIWYVTLNSVVYKYQCFGGIAVPILYPEAGVSRFLWNIGTYLQN